MTQKDLCMVAILAVLVVLTQLIRCKKEQFYTSIARDPKMQNHVLNRKYALNTKNHVDYPQINRYYLVASLFSFFAAILVFVLIDYFVGVLSFFALYSASYATVAGVIGRRYRHA